MRIQDFLSRIGQDPHLKVVYQDPTICIIRCSGPEGAREIRVGLWAVHEHGWERIVQAFRIPVSCSAG